MQTFLALTKRNIKMFFKDKGLFFTSLITPVILLVLYATFLARVYHDSFVSNIPDYLNVSDKLINGTVGGELFSSLLAVCCVTVAFCSNTLMAQDKLTGARKDFMITPVKKSTLAISYYVATLLTTLIVSYIATGACFIYIAIEGWFLSVGDVFLILIDVFLLTLFGTAISSRANISCWYNCFSWLWIHLWCLYAYFTVFTFLTKSNCLFARYLWYITYKKSCIKWCL